MAYSNIKKGDLHLKLLAVSEGVIFEEKSGEIVLRNLRNDSYISVGIKEYCNEYYILEEEKKTIDASSSKTKKKQLDGIAKKKQELLNFFSDVKYNCTLVGNGLNISKLDHVSPNRGVSMHIEIKPFLSGGGKFYVEAFHKERQPRLIAPYGIFFSARGKENVVRIAWSDCSFNPINEPVRFGSTVLLHVYTQNLYGQELDVELIDKVRPIFKPNDPLYEEKVEDDDKEKIKKFLDREGEINIHEYNESIDAGEIASGNLISLLQSTDEKVVTTPFVQKGIWLIKIHESWCEKEGKELKVFPYVKDKRGVHFNGFERKYLLVDSNSSTVCFPPPKGKSPAKVGQVATNLGVFKPCFYTYIKARVDELPEILLFSENNSTNLTDEYILPLTAGVVYEQSLLRIILNTDTSNCLYETTSPEHMHKGKVIDLSQFPKFAPYDKVGGDYVKWDSEKIFLGGEVKEEKNEFKVGTTYRVPGGCQVEISKKIPLFESPSKLKGEANDSGVSLCVAYDYSNWQTQSPIEGILKAIWPNNRHIAQRYPIKIHTCRYPSKTIYVDVYPDIKWTLQLGLNYDAKKLKEVKKKYHEDWQLVGESNLSKSRRHNLNQEEKKKFKEEAYKAMKKSKKQITPALLFSEDAIVAGIVDFQIGLIAEFDGENFQIEAKDLFPEVIGFVKKIFNITKKIDKIIDGTDEQAKKNTELKMHPEREKKLREKVKAKKANRSTNYSFIPPEIGLSIGWKAERPEDVDKPLMGTTFTGKIDANPLFGFEIKYDILDLLGKAVPHPVVKAVIMFLQVLDDVAGDSFDICLDLIVTGKVKLEGEGKISTLKSSHIGSESPFKLEGEIKIKILAEIKVQGSTETFLFGEVGAYAELSGEVITGITFAGTVNAEEDGLFLVPSIEFHGIILRGKVLVGIVEVDRKGKEFGSNKQDFEKKPGIHYGAEMEITVMQAYKWSLDEWKIPIMRNIINN